jgi:N-methylhydantoinase A
LGNLSATFGVGVRFADDPIPRHYPPNLLLWAPKQAFGLERMSAILGVDVGGTFTDFFLRDVLSGEARSHKIASTPDDPSRAILEGLRVLLPRGALGFLAHGTTVGTNALIQRRGGRVALITTAGFKDLLEIGRQTRPKIYDLRADHPEPLVPRERRFEVDERIGPNGEVLRQLSDAAVERAVAEVAASKAESVAVCLLFCFVNPVHERRIGRALRAALPQIHVSLSCDVQPEFREYERLSTTVLNAFLQPIVSRYLAHLKNAVGSHAPETAIGVCQSSGGLMSLERATEMPIRTALSGPAAGVVGAIAAGLATGHSNLITFDMGGTSTDVCLVLDAKAEMTFARSVAGFPVRLPSLDIHTVGAGGGSIAHIATDGLMRTGPMSAGAVPGPACYGRGGTDPTVSDANLVLGRLPDILIGGRMRLDRSLAEAALIPLAQKLGLGLRETALGIIRIVNANMIRAIRVVSVERGYDPRDFALMAFGGAGGLHAVEIAREIGIRTVLVPAAPGILCAEGVAASVLEESFVASCRVAIEDKLAPVAAICAELTDAATQWLDKHDTLATVGSQDVALDMRYVGQNFELAIPIPQGKSLPHPDWLKRAFLDAHQRKYGHHDPTAAIEIVNVRVTVRKATTHLVGQRLGVRPMRSPPVSTIARPVWFNTDRPIDVPFIERSGLALGTTLEGPLVVTQYDATTLVPPNCRLGVEEDGNIVIKLNHDPAI